MKPFTNTYGKKNKAMANRTNTLEIAARIGDWEIDLIIGENHKGAIVTATERKTNYELIAPVKSKPLKQVKKALINMFAPYKEQVLSITCDNGREFFKHQAKAKKLT